MSTEKEQDKDFKLYESGELVAEAETLIMSISETKPYKYKLENISIKPNFKLLNTPDNKYTISFVSDTNVTYSLTDCIINNRTRVSDDYLYIEYLSGDFDTLIADTDNITSSEVNLTSSEPIDLSF